MSNKTTDNDLLFINKLFDKSKNNQAKEIQELRGLLVDAVKVIEFYANKKSWQESSHNHYREIRNDEENLYQSWENRPDILHPVGGKRARAFISRPDVKAIPEKEG